MTGRIDKWCVMCGAAPGEPCTVISGNPANGINPGDERAEPHFYRHADEKPAVAVKDEPLVLELQAVGAEHRLIRAKDIVPRLDALEAERDEVQVALRECEASFAEVERAATRYHDALQRVIAEAQAAWKDVDALDDTGGHVGIATHARAQAGGLSAAADIARAALAGGSP